MSIKIFIIAIPFLLISCTSNPQSSNYDLVLVGGRVMDPQSGLDEVRNLGITGGRIAAISSAQLNGKQVITVSGLIIAPGFIDLHSHGQTDENLDEHG